MSAAARIHIAISGSGSGKPKPKRPNAVRRIMDREQSRERRVRESSVVATPNNGGSAGPAKKPSRLQCANKACKKPNVVDGTCQTCGSVADDSNIVSEITFGETSSGAAMVQGSYLAADQGGVRGVGGLAFRRVAGGGASEARERSLREAKQLLNQFTQQLRISQNLSDTAYRFYRMASNNNFVQGRRKNNVAAICLYAACRKDYNNKIMLIDLADLVKTDVFLLGRGYKEFLNQFPDLREGTKPIILEDLIFRFASKLEFYHDTNKVAESAVRIAARMRHDNMTHGRRPAGICGAAIIMAARAHNYRRTVREVVYIAKVTMTTLQERMEEFANVPSAQMTISEFHDQDVLPPAFDPPFVYKSTQEWKDKHARPKKRKSQSITTDDDNETPGEGQQDHTDKRPRTESNGTQPIASDGTPPPAQNGFLVTPAPSASPAPLSQGGPAPIIDKDGFVVPPLPQRRPASVASPLAPAPTPPDEPMTDVVSASLAAVGEGEKQLEALASEYGDSDSEDSDIDPSSEMAMAAAQGIEVPLSAKRTKQSQNGSPAKAPRKKKKTVELPINGEWEMDEANLEQEMEGHLNDPALIGASQVVTKDIEDKRAKETEGGQTTAPGVATEDNTGGPDVNNPESAQPGPEPEPESDSPLDPRFTPRSKVSNDPIVREDEFKDDPEVEYCLLGEAEVKVKERIWANHNKDYLRKVQQKIFESKMAENAPPKQRRNRTRKPRIGEGQASPAGSAEEAAVNMMRTRGISTKIDYSRLGQVFDLSNSGPGSRPGSTYGGASSVGSLSALGSEAGSDDEDDQEGLQSPSPPRVSDTGATVGAPTGPSSIPPPVAPKPTVPTVTGGQTEQGDADDFGDEDEEDYDDTTNMYNGGHQNGYEDETFVEEDIDPFADNDNGDDGYDDMDED